MGWQALAAAAAVVTAVATCACGDSTGSGDSDSDGDGGGGGFADGARPPPDSRVSQYIRGDLRTSLVIEVDSVSGSEPRPTSQTDVVQALEPLLDKPAGIDVVLDGELASRGADHAWTEDELFELADQTFDRPLTDRQVAMHVLSIDGHSARDSENGVILGLAWANTHIAVFQQTIEDMCNGAFGLPSSLREQLCSAAETSIWIHEIGHVIGLVDNGLPMVGDHRDPAHGAHDASDDCVMYWAYEGEGLIDLMRDRLLGGNTAALAFDDACKADIAAVRDAD